MRALVSVVFVTNNPVLNHKDRGTQLVKQGGRGERIENSRLESYVRLVLAG